MNRDIDELLSSIAFQGKVNPEKLLQLKEKYQKKPKRVEADKIKRPIHETR